MPATYTIYQRLRRQDGHWEKWRIYHPNYAGLEKEDAIGYMQFLRALEPRMRRRFKGTEAEYEIRKD